MKKSLVLCVALLAAVASLLGCARGTIGGGDASAEAVDGLFARWDGDDTPGAAVLVVKDKRILVKKCYGLRNIEKGEEIGPDTAFLLGSITKQFTAMAVMMLAERGEISYDDPVTDYLPAFNDFAMDITVRHLLEHTGGLPEFDALFLAGDLIDSAWPRSAKSEPSAFQPTRDDALELLYRVEEPRFPAGAEWEYSNSGYVVLGRIVEVVSGRSLAEFLDANIFKPLGMAGTFLNSAIRPEGRNVASSYSYAGGSYEEIDYAPQNAVYGGNNVYSTIDDLYRWDQALYTEELVSRRALDEAFTPGRTADGKDVGYGFGWRIGDRDGYKELSHGGRWLGFRTGILRIPEERFTVVILSNTADSRMADWMDRLVELYL